ncbi:MAG: hypothetical protein U0P30_13830 [Vicinamibacterales bacterium]
MSDYALQRFESITARSTASRSTGRTTRKQEVAMESISPRRVRTAMCDQYAFYPFRDLLTGNLKSIDDLALAERFARVVALHDAIVMEGEPMPAPPDTEHEWITDEMTDGRRMVITAFMPNRAGYGELFVNNLGPDPLGGQALELSESLKTLAVVMSGAEPGDPYHRAHERFIHRMTQTLRSGASIACGGRVGTALRERASRYPEQLFAQFDADLQAFAREAQNARIGVTVPPVLSIVLARCGTRDEIVQRLLELREEWKEPRDRMWARIEDLQRASPAEVQDITEELERASELLSPVRPRAPLLPSRVLWELVALGGALHSGSKIMAALAGAQAAHSISSELPAAARLIFRRGAIDLARRVRADLLMANGVPDLLDRFLTDNERRSLT